MIEDNHFLGKSEICFDLSITHIVYAQTMHKYIYCILLLTSSSTSAFLTTPHTYSPHSYAPNSLHTFPMKNSQPRAYSALTSLKMVDKKSVMSFLPIRMSEKNELLVYDIPLTSEICAIMLVYFAQGLLGISRLAVSFYFKDALHLTPVDMTMISTISVIPWIIKPLYGFISDTFPLFGYKRKTYLVLSGLLGTVSWKLLESMASGDSSSVAYSVLLVSLSSLGLAFSDVLVDAIVVSKSRDQNKSGSLQSICWSATAIGGLISAYFSGHLLQQYGTSFVFGLTSIVPLIMTGSAVLIDEEKLTKVSESHTNVLSSLKTQAHNIWNIIKQKSILYPLLFLTIWNITPTSGSALFYFETNELGFQPEFFGKLGLVSSISSLFGIVIYNQKFKSVPLRTIFKWSCILGSVLGTTPLLLVTHMNRIIGMPDTWFAMLDDIVLSIFGQITFMPVMILAAQMCPPGAEAMLYATIMSANNLSGTIGRMLGGMLMKGLDITDHNFSNLPALLVLTNILGLIPLLFLQFIPKEDKKNIGK